MNTTEGLSGDTPKTPPPGHHLPRSGSDHPLFEPHDWEARLTRQIADHVQRKARQKAERDGFKERRNYGLAARHRTKTARNAAANKEQPCAGRSTNQPIGQSPTSPSSSPTQSPATKQP